jgi:nitrogen fixation NifU-like protein
MDIFDDLEGMIVEEAKKKYSDQVMDHFMNPRNNGPLESPDAFNAMTGICGDTIGFFVGIENGEISRIAWVSDGCGPTVACSSALSCMAQGKRVDDALEITSKELLEYLGGLPLENTHCADLAVNTLKSTIRKTM